MKAGLNASMLVACLAVLSASPAPSAPEPEWPVEWTAFGPVPPVRDMAKAGLPAEADLLPGNRLTSISAELDINGRRYPARTVRLEACRIDFDRELGETFPRGTTVYLLAPIRAASDTTLRMGAGADWWMHWWLDGRPVYDTLLSSNAKVPVAISNHVFQAPLTRGEHVLAVAVIRGKSSFLFAAGGPEELRNPPQPKALTGYAEAMAEGQKAPVADSAGASRSFRQAYDMAATDTEKADALLALGRACLADAYHADRATVRADFERVLAVEGLPKPRYAEAWLGIAEARLAESNYPAAREACERAETACEDPRWTAQAQLVRAWSFLQERQYPAARREFARLLERPDLVRDVTWEAEALHDALPLLARVRPDHPRLFFNADSWPAVKARALTDEQALLDLMKSQVERLSLDAIRPCNWGATDQSASQFGIMEAAFVYRVTGDPAVLEKVRRMLHGSVQDRWSGYVAAPLIKWLAALDWVWNDLPPGEREALADAMLRYAWNVVSAAKAKGEMSGWPHYYMGNLYAYAGIVLLDPAAGDVDYARAAALLGLGFRQHRLRFAQLIRIAGDDGAWQTNVDYDFERVPFPVFSFLYAWRAATGAEIPPEWAHVGTTPDFVLRMLLDLDKSHIRHFNYAGHSNGNWGFGEIGASDPCDHLGHFMQFFSSSHPQEAAIAHALRRRLLDAGVRSSTGLYPVFQFLMTDTGKAPPPRLPDGLPTARFYEGNGLVLMSSGFGSNETYALFSQGGGESGWRHDFDATHFSIYKGGFLALDTGTRFALPHSPNYRHQTVAHNAVLIHMPGEKFPPSATGPVESNTGGQNRPPQQARPLAFETDRLFAYTAVDATPVYHTNKCAQMVRQFVFLPPDHFVVFDRVTAKRAEYPKAWLLHTANEPVIAGREFRADQGEGRLFCRTLLPADAVLEPIGGPGKEFWADGRNWAATHAFQDPGAGDWWKRFGRGHPSPPEAMGRWRVEVTPGAARTDDCFLHLIQVGDQAVEQMVESRLRERGDRVALEFSANGRDYEVTLNRTGDVGGHITVTEKGGRLVDRDLARTLMPQSGLALEP